VEGEHSRADRNRGIGMLELRAEAGHDVPEGAEVQLTVEVDTSRLVTAQAYIPLLDLPLKGLFHLDEAFPDHATLSREVQAELNRLQTVRSLADGNSAAVSALDRIEAEGTVEDLSRFLRHDARADPDAAAEAANRLLDLRAAPAASAATRAKGDHRVPRARWTGRRLARDGGEPVFRS
jgi:molecular chaperone DnaK